MDEKKIVEPIKKETNDEKAEKSVSTKTSKKKYIIIAIGLLLVAVGIFVFFIQNNSGKKITFYRYKNGLFVKGHGYIEDIDNNNLEKYTYKCTHKKCAIIESNSVGLEIKDNWVLIDDSNDLSDYVSTGAIVAGISRDDYYILYNVVKNKKIKLFLNKNMGVDDLLLDANGTPVAMLISESKDDGVSKVAIDLKTNERLIDTNDIIYGSTRKDYRNLSIINNGKDDYYLFTSENYSNKLLYDKNMNYVTDIYSEDYFDDDGNIIKIVRDDKTEKEYFAVYGVDGKLIRKSKSYDDVDADNGFLIIQNNGVVSIYNSREKELTEISKQGKKYEYSTYYNRYYSDDKNMVSVFELQKPNDDVDKKVTLYRYDVKNNKLDKKSMNFDGYSEPYAALSRFYLEGYDTKKIDSSTFYFDKIISKSRKEELQKKIDELYKEKLTKKLFSAKQNIYLFSTYNYQIFNHSDYICYDSSSISISNIYADGVSINNTELVYKMAVNYYKSNQKKLNNDVFKKIYNKYYSYFGGDIRFVGKSCYSYNEEGFFGRIVSSYYYNQGSRNVDNELSIFQRKIEEAGLRDEFDQQVEKYVESYVLK